MKIEPDKMVIEWFKILEDQPIILTAISVAELRYGILALPDGKRKDPLDKAVTDMINEAQLVAHQKAYPSSRHIMQIF